MSRETCLSWAAITPSFLPSLQEKGGKINSRRSELDAEAVARGSSLLFLQCILSNAGWLIGVSPQECFLIK